MKEKEVLKIFSTLCTIGFLTLAISFQVPWMGYLIKEKSLIKVEAEVIKITVEKSRVNSFRREGFYRTTISYTMDGEKYEMHIISDEKDWSNYQILLEGIVE